MIETFHIEKVFADLIPAADEVGRTYTLVELLRVSVAEEEEGLEAAEANCAAAGYLDAKYKDFKVEAAKALVKRDTMQDPVCVAAMTRLNDIKTQQAKALGDYEYAKARFTAIRAQADIASSAMRYEAKL